MRKPKLLVCLLAVGLISGTSLVVSAQRGQTDWNKPFPPHKVIGNVYFVGSEQLASFLIATPEGHILINSGFETTVPVIRAAVEKLGFRFTDIKILLGSHAHGDHMEGDALIKELTGATDKYAQLEKGGANPFMDPQGLKNHLEAQEKSFLARLEEQKAAAR